MEFILEGPEWLVLGEQRFPRNGAASSVWRGKCVPVLEGHCSSLCLLLPVQCLGAHLCVPAHSLTSPLPSKTMISETDKLQSTWGLKVPLIDQKLWGVPGRLLCAYRPSILPFAEEEHALMCSTALHSTLHSPRGERPHWDVVPA